MNIHAFAGYVFACLAFFSPAFLSANGSLWPPPDSTDFEKNALVFASDSLGNGPLWDNGGDAALELADEDCNNYTSAGTIGMIYLNAQVNPLHICENDHGNIVSFYVPPGGTPEFIWVSSTSGCPTSSTNPIPGATGAAYYTPQLTQTTWFSRGIRNQGCTNYLMSPCAQLVVSTSIGINVTNPGTVGYDQTICSGGDPAAFVNITSPTGGSGTTQYMWLWSTASCASSFTTAPGSGNSPTYDPPGGITQTTWYRRCVQKVGCRSWIEDACTVITPNSVSPGSIGYDQTICSGGNPVAFVSTAGATGSGTILYQWQSNTASCSGTWSNISGATAATYDPPPLSVATYYRRVATSVLNGVSCSAASNCLTITITPSAISITGQPTGGVFCAGGSMTLCVTASGTNLAYQWKYWDGFVWTAISGATAACYTASPASSTTYRVDISDDCGGAASSSQVSVSPNSVSPGSIGSSQIICSGTDLPAFTNVAAATGYGTISYQWQSNTASCSGTWSDISGATAATYDPPVLSATTYYRRVATSLLSGVPCSAASNCLSITINATVPSISWHPTSAIICPSGIATLSLTAANATSYQWQYFNGISWGSLANGTPSGSIYANATSAALGISGISVTGTFSYRCVVVGPCSNVVSNTATLTVAQLPAPTAANSGPVCSGQTVTLTASGLAPNGQAAAFNGSNQYVTVTQSIPTTNLTVEAWVKTSAATGGIFSASDNAAPPSTAHDRHIYLSGGQIWVRVYNASAWNTGFTINDGQWHHVAFVLQSGVGQRVYVDGALSPSSNALDYSQWSGQTTFRMGYSEDGGYLNGQMDNARLWNVARTQAQILADFRLSTPSSATGLIANYLFSGNTNAATGNNGTAPNGISSYIAPNLYTYTWSGTGAPAPTTSESVNMTATASGTYSLTYAVAGCASPAASTVLTLTQMPAPTAANSGPVCSGQTVVLTASGLAPSGQAASFNGSNQYVTVTQNLPETNLTVEMWFKTSASTGGLFSVAAAGGAHDRHLYLSGGQLWVRVYNSAAWNTGATVNDGQWHHLAFVLQSGLGQRVYLDGVLTPNTNTYDHSDFNWDTYFLFGYSVDGGYLNGQIDNARLWDVARTQAQIAADFRLSTPSNATGLVANYLFSGNVNAATGTNGTAPNGISYAAPNLYTYTWSGTGAPAPTTSESVNMTATTSGTYSLTYAVASGCGSAAASTVLSTNASPIVTAGSNSPCLGQNLNLTASVSGGTNPLVYQWSGPLGFSSAAQNPSFLVLLAGFGGTYSISVTDAAGCSGASAKVVAVGSPPPAPCPIQF